MRKPMKSEKYKGYTIKFWKNWDSMHGTIDDYSEGIYIEFAVYKGKEFIFQDSADYKGEALESAKSWIDSQLEVK